MTVFGNVIYEFFYVFPSCTISNYYAQAFRRVEVKSEQQVVQ